MTTTSKSLVTGTDLEGKERMLEKHKPYQMDLFQMLTGPKDKHSNTIELYDGIPKYFTCARTMAAMRIQGEFLRTLTRKFKYRDKEYRLEMSPARVKQQDGRFVEYFPSEREQIVEEALRKIACDGLAGVYLDDKAGVQFSLRQLMRELQKHRHSIKYPALIEALTVCNRTNITVIAADGKTVLQSAIFPVVLIKNRREWEDNPQDAYCYVQFNPLVTASLRSLTYRQFNYVTNMGYKHPLTRWLHKRMSHHYTQADISKPYHIKASTIIRDSGLIEDKVFSRAIRKIERSLDELKTPLKPGERETVLINYKEAKTLQDRLILDVVYELTPSPFFVDEVKKANWHSNTLATRAKGDGKLQERIENLQPVRELLG